MSCVAATALASALRVSGLLALTGGLHRWARFAASRKISKNTEDVALLLSQQIEDTSREHTSVVATLHEERDALRALLDESRLQLVSSHSDITGLQCATVVSGLARYPSLRTPFTMVTATLLSQARNGLARYALHTLSRFHNHVSSNAQKTGMSTSQLHHACSRWLHTAIAPCLHHWDLQTRLASVEHDKESTSEQLHVEQFKALEAQSEAAVEQASLTSELEKVRKAASLMENQLTVSNNKGDALSQELRDVKRQYKDILNKSRAGRQEAAVASGSLKSLQQKLQDSEVQHKVDRGAVASAKQAVNRIRGEYQDKQSRVLAMSALVLLFSKQHRVCMASLLRRLASVALKAAWITGVEESHEQQAANAVTVQQADAQPMPVLPSSAGQVGLNEATILHFACRALRFHALHSAFLAMFQGSLKWRTNMRVALAEEHATQLKLEAGQSKRNVEITSRMFAADKLHCAMCLTSKPALVSALHMWIGFACFTVPYSDKQSAVDCHIQSLNESLEKAQGIVELRDAMSSASSHSRKVTAPLLLAAMSGYHHRRTVAFTCGFQCLRLAVVAGQVGQSLQDATDLHNEVVGLHTEVESARVDASDARKQLQQNQSSLEKLKAESATKASEELKECRRQLREQIGTVKTLKDELCEEGKSKQLLLSEMQSMKKSKIASEVRGSAVANAKALKDGMAEQLKSLQTMHTDLQDRYKQDKGLFDEAVDTKADLVKEIRDLKRKLERGKKEDTGRAHDHEQLISGLRSEATTTQKEMFASVLNAAARRTTLDRLHMGFNQLRYMCESLRMGGLVSALEASLAGLQTEREYLQMDAASVPMLQNAVLKANREASDAKRDLEAANDLIVMLRAVDHHQAAAARLVPSLGDVDPDSSVPMQTTESIPTCKKQVMVLIIWAAFRHAQTDMKKAFFARLSRADFETAGVEKDDDVCVSAQEMASVVAEKVLVSGLLHDAQHQLTDMQMNEAQVCTSLAQSKLQIAATAIYNSYGRIVLRLLQQGIASLRSSSWRAHAQAALDQVTNRSSQVNTELDKAIKAASQDKSQHAREMKSSRKRFEEQIAMWRDKLEKFTDSAKENAAHANGKSAVLDDITEGDGYLKAEREFQHRTTQLRKDCRDYRKENSVLKKQTQTQTSRFAEIQEILDALTARCDESTKESDALVQQLELGKQQIAAVTIQYESLSEEHSNNNNMAHQWRASRIIAHIADKFVSRLALSFLTDWSHRCCAARSSRASVLELEQKDIVLLLKVQEHACALSDAHREHSGQASMQAKTLQTQAVRILQLQLSRVSHMALKVCFTCILMQTQQQPNPVECPAPMSLHRAPSETKAIQCMMVADSVQPDCKSYDTGMFHVFLCVKTIVNTRLRHVVHRWSTLATERTRLSLQAANQSLVIEAGRMKEDNLCLHKEQRASLKRSADMTASWRTEKANMSQAIQDLQDKEKEDREQGGYSRAEKEFRHRHIALRKEAKDAQKINSSLQLSIDRSTHELKEQRASNEALLVKVRHDSQLQEDLQRSVEVANARALVAFAVATFEMWKVKSQRHLLHLALSSMKQYANDFFTTEALAQSKRDVDTAQQQVHALERDSNISAEHTNELVGNMQVQEQDARNTINNLINRHAKCLSSVRAAWAWRCWRQRINPRLRQLQAQYSEQFKASRLVQVACVSSRQISSAMAFVLTRLRSLQFQHACSLLAQSKLQKAVDRVWRTCAMIHVHSTRVALQFGLQRWASTHRLARERKIIADEVQDLQHRTDDAHRETKQWQLEVVEARTSLAVTLKTQTTLSTKLKAAEQGMTESVVSMKQDKLILLKQIDERDAQIKLFREDGAYLRAEKEFQARASHLRKENARLSKELQKGQAEWHSMTLIAKQAQIERSNAEERREHGASELSAAMQRATTMAGELSSTAQDLRVCKATYNTVNRSSSSMRIANVCRLWCAGVLHKVLLHLLHAELHDKLRRSNSEIVQRDIRLMKHEDDSGRTSKALEDEHSRLEEITRLKARLEQVGAHEQLSTETSRASARQAYKTSCAAMVYFLLTHGHRVRSNKKMQTLESFCNALQGQLKKADSSRQSLLGVMEAHIEKSRSTCSKLTEVVRDPPSVQGEYGCNQPLDDAVGPLFRASQITHGCFASADRVHLAVQAQDRKLDDLSAFYTLVKADLRQLQTRRTVNAVVIAYEHCKRTAFHHLKRLSDLRLLQALQKSSDTSVGQKLSSDLEAQEMREQVTQLHSQIRVLRIDKESLRRRLDESEETLNTFNQEPAYERASREFHTRSMALKKEVRQLRIDCDRANLQLEQAVRDADIATSERQCAQDRAVGLESQLSMFERGGFVKTLDEAKHNLNDAEVKASKLQDLLSISKSGSARAHMAFAVTKCASIVARCMRSAFTSLSQWAHRRQCLQYVDNLQSLLGQVECLTLKVCEVQAEKARVDSTVEMMQSSLYSQDKVQHIVSSAVGEAKLSYGKEIAHVQEHANTLAGVALSAESSLRSHQKSMRLQQLMASVPFAQRSWMRLFFRCWFEVELNSKEMALKMKLVDVTVQRDNAVAKHVQLSDDGCKREKQIADQVVVYTQLSTTLHEQLQAAQDHHGVFKNKASSRIRRHQAVVALCQQIDAHCRNQHGHGHEMLRLCFKLLWSYQVVAQLTSEMAYNSSISEMAYNSSVSEMAAARQRDSISSKENACFVLRIDDLQREDAHARAAWAVERKGLQAVIAKSAEQMESFRDSDVFARAEREFKNRVVVLKKENKASKDTIQQLEEDREAASTHALKLEQRVLQMMDAQRQKNEQVQASNQKEKACTLMSDALNNRRYQTLLLASLINRLPSLMFQAFTRLRHQYPVKTWKETVETSSQTYCGTQTFSQKQVAADKSAALASERALCDLQDQLKKHKAVAVVDKCALREATDASQKATRDYRRVYSEFKECKRKEAKHHLNLHTTLLGDCVKLWVTRVVAYTLRRLACASRE